MELTKPKLVILDRDGVINEDSDNYIKSAEEWQPIAGSIDAIKKLKQHGIKVAIATNQSGIGRGLFSIVDLGEMHQKLYELLAEDSDAIDHIAYCPHEPGDRCHCRKPNIGMLEEISNKLNIVLTSEVYFVGDSFKDIQAAVSANCTPVLVKTGKGAKTMTQQKKALMGVMIFDNLQKFVESII